MSTAITEHPVTPLQVKIDFLCIICAEVFGTSVRSMISHSRADECKRARAVAYYVLKCAGMSLKQTGDVFDGRDHATVHNGLQVFDDLFETDPSFRNSALLIINRTHKIITGSTEWLKIPAL